MFACVVAFVAYFAVVIGFFALLFTGRWPESIHRFVVNTARLILRLNVYARLLVDDYPPFDLDGDAQPIPAVA